MRLVPLTAEASRQGRGLDVVAAVVLSFAVDRAKPLWQHWWFAARMCGGTLASADLADVLPDERLQNGTDEVFLEEAAWSAGSLRATTTVPSPSR